MRLSEGRSLQLSIPADLVEVVDGYVARQGGQASGVIRALVSAALAHVSAGGQARIQAPPGVSKGRVIRVRFDADLVAGVEAYAGERLSLAGAAVELARVAVEAGLPVSGPAKARIQRAPGDRRGRTAERDYPGRRLGDLMRAVCARRGVDAATAAAQAGLSLPAWAAVEAGTVAPDDDAFGAVLVWIDRAVTPAPSSPSLDVDGFARDLYERIGPMLADAVQAGASRARAPKVSAVGVVGVARVIDALREARDRVEQGPPMPDADARRILSSAVIRAVADLQGLPDD